MWRFTVTMNVFAFDGDFHTGLPVGGIGGGDGFSEVFRSVSWAARRYHEPGIHFR